MQRCRDTEMQRHGLIQAVGAYFKVQVPHPVMKTSQILSWHTNKNNDSKRNFKNSLLHWKQQFKNKNKNLRNSIHSSSQRQEIHISVGHWDCHVIWVLLCFLFFSSFICNLIMCSSEGVTSFPQLRGSPVVQNLVHQQSLFSYLKELKEGVSQSSSFLDEQFPDSLFWNEALVTSGLL